MKTYVFKAMILAFSLSLSFHSVAASDFGDDQYIKDGDETNWDRIDLSQGLEGEINDDALETVSETQPIEPAALPVNQTNKARFIDNLTQEEESELQEIDASFSDQQ